MQRINSPSNQLAATSMRSSSSSPQILSLSQLDHTSTPSEGSRFLLPLPQYEAFVYEIYPVSECEWDIHPNIAEDLINFNPRPNFCRILQNSLAHNIKDDEENTHLYWCLGAILREKSHQSINPVFLSYWAITQLKRHLIYAKGFAPTLLPYTPSECQPPPPYTPSE